MPRDGSGLYSKPSGTTVVPNTTIESAKYNAMVDDLVEDANNARPVVAGGTGSATAAGARTNLGIDKVSDSGIETSVPLFDATDDTIKLAFDISGNTTGTTRTWEVPDANDTVVGEAATQTLTNKSLTAPTVTGAADISGATGFEGRLLNVQVITSSGTYTPTAGTKYAFVDVQASGAGGANGNSSGAGEVGGGGGGNSGNRVKVLLDVSGIGTAAVTLGSAGLGATTAGADGGDASSCSWDDGTTSFTVPGGKGGKSASNITANEGGAPPGSNDANTITAGANHIATIIDKIGEQADGALLMGAGPAFAWGTDGRSTEYGSAGRGRVRNNAGTYPGTDATGYGAGGGGGSSYGSQAGGANGGNGSGPILVVTEFSA